MIEFKLWWTNMKWNKKIPKTGLGALDICNKNIYPNINFPTLINLLPVVGLREVMG